MFKAVLFFLAATCYGMLLIYVKPALSTLLGDSVISQWILMLLFLVPTVSLLAFFIRAVHSRHPRNELEKLKRTTSRYELLWSGRLPLVESFWCAYIPSAIFFAAGVNYVTSGINRFVASDIKWATAALSSITALLGLSIFGAWRSGDRYGGKRFWVVLSRSAMVIGTTAICLSFLT